MGGGEAEGGVVAVLRLRDEPLLLEGVGQVAVRVGEVGLQLDGAPVRVDRKVDQPERKKEMISCVVIQEHSLLPAGLETASFSVKYVVSHPPSLKLT